jgi:hypothetical protein
MLLVYSLNYKEFFFFLKIIPLPKIISCNMTCMPLIKKCIHVFFKKKKKLSLSLSHGQSVNPKPTIATKRSPQYEIPETR